MKLVIDPNILVKGFIERQPNYDTLIWEIERVASTKSTGSGPSIFLSYASEDREKVTKIYNSLIDDKFNPWMDHMNLIGGDEWESEITSAIEESAIFVACLSQQAIRKLSEGSSRIKYKLALRDEHEYALRIRTRLPRFNFPIVPLCLENCTIPSSLERFTPQWWDTERSYDDNYPHLKATLEKRLGRYAPSNGSSNGVQICLDEEDNIDSEYKARLAGVGSYRLWRTSLKNNGVIRADWSGLTEACHVGLSCLRPAQQACFVVAQKTQGFLIEECEPTSCSTCNPHAACIAARAALDNALRVRRLPVNTARFMLEAM